MQSKPGKSAKSQKRPRCQAVQPIGWLVDGELPEALRRVACLRMPDPILNTIRQMPRDPLELAPIASLHDAIATFSHAVTAFQPHITRQEETNPRWLYARGDQRINCLRLLTLIKAWLNACDDGEIPVDHRVQQWRRLDWSWDNIDLMEAGGELRRMLLPGLVARWLLDQGFQLTLKSSTGTIPFKLHLVPLMTRRDVAELLTDPILYNRRRYSYVLRFWVETLPESGKLCLYHRTSVRRWLSEPFVENGTVYIKRGRRKSVYLRRSTGYIDESPMQDVFARFTLKRVGKPSDTLRWVGFQARVFELLELDSAFPSVAMLGSVPRQFQEQMLVTMENRESQTKDVGTGLWSNDHRDIFEQLDAHLRSWAVPMDVWTREATADARIPKTRHSRLALPTPARIELYTTDSAQVRETLLDTLGLEDAYRDRISDNPLQIVQDGRVGLEIVDGYAPGLTDTLPKATGSAFFGVRDERRSAIKGMLPKAQQPTGAWVALPNYREQGQRDIDPKDTIRFGLADTGRISQFFVPGAKHTNHRLKSGARDLLRELGCRPQPFVTRPAACHLPAELDLLAFWTIQLNARNRKTEETVILPLVVESPHGAHHLRMWLPGRTEAALYESLYAGILAAAAYSNDFTQPAQIIRFFRDAMEQRSANRPTLLLLVEQNLRRVFPELADQRGSRQLSLNQLLTVNIRVARLRFSRDGDAPFCCPTEAFARYPGLYGNPDLPNVFLSLHDLKNRPVGKGWRKLDYPQSAAVNPSTVQIWLNNLQPDDVPVEWAALIHRLRTASWHVPIATLLPQPLHDAVYSSSKYLSRLAVDTANDDVNALSEDDHG